MNLNILKILIFILRKKTREKTSEFVVDFSKIEESVKMLNILSEHNMWIYN